MLGVLSDLVDFLLPRTCVVCGRQLLSVERDICVCCEADMPLTYFWTRSRNPMADRFNERVEAPSYAWAASLFYYREGEGWSNITKSLKYGRNFGAGRHFSAMLGAYLASSPEFADVDAVVPVPLHWTRRFRRGYNQAEVIASVLASCLPSAVLDCHLLRRVRRTGTQTRLDVEHKAANVAGAFRCTGRTDAGHVLLVDDVFTTGSTVAECTFALRAALGPDVRISVATLAYVGD